MLVEISCESGVLRNNAKSYGLSGFVPSVTFINQNRSVLKGTFAF